MATTLLIFVLADFCVVFGVALAAGVCGRRRRWWGQSAAEAWWSRRRWRQLRRWRWRVTVAVAAAVVAFFCRKTSLSPKPRSTTIIIHDHMFLTSIWLEHSHLSLQLSSVFFRLSSVNLLATKSELTVRKDAEGPWKRMACGRKVHQYVWYSIP